MYDHYEVPEFTARETRLMARRALNGKWGRGLLPMLIIIALLVIPELLEYGTLMFGSGIDWTDPDSLMKYLQSSSEGRTGVLPDIMAAAAFFITGPLSVSAGALSLRILRNEGFTTETAFTGFKRYFQSFFVYVQVWIFSMLWSLITVLPGTAVLTAAALKGSPVLLAAGVLVFVACLVGYIYLILRYSMSYFIAADNRELPATQAVAYSVTLMKGRAGKYFLLQLSFIGWVILASLPMAAGIAFFASGIQSESIPLKVAGIGLAIIGIVAITLLELYMYTANAVFYSAVSGNFGIARPAASAEAVQDYTEEIPEEKVQLPEDAMISEENEESSDRSADQAASPAEEPDHGGDDPDSSPENTEDEQ